MNVLGVHDWESRMIGPGSEFAADYANGTDGLSPLSISLPDF